ncbi:MAG: dTDP-4-dehydrorhamnose 3,5-epimerase family protein [Planctomycetes bacterium]|jgi:dTDP-4-dehydrorhamnose 3,5-epimerase|nr:dTDP-4-dehydrorhamnose 3,5-epimerase family protein [Planctomycetota bacterium]
MIDGVVVQKLNKFEDQRGWLIEFFRNDETEYQPVMAYLSVTNPGVVRGPHEHTSQSDYFVFAGPGSFILHLWDHREGSATKEEYMKIEGGADDPVMVLVPPGVVHGYKCVSAEPGWCVNLPDKLYKGEGKKEEVDEIRWEERDDSPYQIN